MTDLRAKNTEIKQLNAAIDTIRGTLVDNSQSQYKCRNVDNPRKASGGSCTPAWNEFVFHRHEYFRFHCRLKYSRWNDTVEHHRLTAIDKEKDYHACFSKNIPTSIQEDFIAYNRETFLETYFKKRNELEELQPLGLTYKKLAIACNSELENLASMDRAYVDRFNVACSP
jgi:hypothetical protein